MLTDCVDEPVCVRLGLVVWLAVSVMLPVSVGVSVGVRVCVWLAESVWLPLQVCERVPLAVDEGVCVSLAVCDGDGGTGTSATPANGKDATLAMGDAVVPLVGRR